MEEMDDFWTHLVERGISLGQNILAAIVVYFIGRYLIKFINKITAKMLEKKEVDPAVKSFVKSAVNILLTVLMVIAIISTLGIETTSFAALLASAGVAVGMALSGNLQNFAGGLMVLLFKPYRIGDYIETPTNAGTVQDIQIFHTILLTFDNKTIFVPNGLMSSEVLINYSRQQIRGEEWTVGLEYGVDVDKVRSVVKKMLEDDARILTNPASQIFIGDLADSSIKLVIRAWVNQEVYWDVMCDINEKIYKSFKEAGIDFSFPQLTVHQA